MEQNGDYDGDYDGDLFNGYDRFSFRTVSSWIAA